MITGEIRGDFDHDGRASGSAPERSARRKWPGLVLLANLDSDMPGGSPAATRAPDNRLRLRSSKDNELEPLGIQVTLPVPQSCELHLELPDDVGLLDAGFASLPVSSARRVAVAPPQATVDLFVEATTLLGSPLAKADENDSAMLQLICQEPSSFEIVDHALVSIAPWVLPNPTQEPIELYIATLEGNQPTVRELTEIAGSFRGLKLIPVSAEDHHGDSWLQDQFKVGYCYGPRQTLRVTLHLPRARGNFLQSADPLSGNFKETRNLASFVRRRFQGPNQAVFADFWNRTIPVLTTSGANGVSFFETIPVAYQMAQLLQLRDDARRVANRPADPDAPITFAAARTEMGSYVGVALKNLRQLAKDATTDAERAWYEKHAETLERRYHVILQTYPPVRKGQSAIPVRIGQQSHLLSAQSFQEFHQRVDEMHTEMNYGGNLEATPPLKEAPLGKILIGSSLADGDSADPDLLRFLQAQRTQPLVRLDTTWLKVGHLDEAIAVVPAPKTGATWCVLRASPVLGIAILEAARDLYRAGLNGNHPHKSSFAYKGTVGRSMTDGTSPVTHLLRGREWLHQHPKGVAIPTEPPLIYQDLTVADARLDSSARDIKVPFVPGEHEGNLWFAAKISVLEVLQFDGGSNAYLEDQVVAPTVAAMMKELPGVAAFPVPVLFDRLPRKAVNPRERAKDPRLPEFRPVTRRTASAFVPNMINLQVLGKTLLVPRPYGPRMSPADAAAVIQQVIDRLKIPLPDSISDQTFSSADSRFLRRTIHWADETNSEVRYLETFVNREFEDGFPRDLQARKRVFMALNRREFTGSGSATQLRGGWRRIVLEEGSVDLFEAYVFVLARTLGLAVRFVDCWSYHLTAGELHCGTNVVRKASNDPKTRWWTWLPPPKLHDEG